MSSFPVSSFPVSSKAELRPSVRRLMESAWRPDGFCVPHRSVYRFQWLWDSCFHAVVWAELGDDRGLDEIATALAHQDPVSGFVPHMTYWGDPDHHLDFWGRSGVSAITQPPMYGHALAVWADRGADLPDRLTSAARHGLNHLLARRRLDEALVHCLHPWETGCDDSPRWDAWFDGPTWNPTGWRQTKGRLVAGLDTDASGCARDSSLFRVASCGFNALVAWNIAELARVGEADEQLLAGAAEITEALQVCWDDARLTWVDPPSTIGSPVGAYSGDRRTADALLPLLTDPRSEALKQLVDPSAFAGAFGVRGVHADEPSHDPDTYWRGPSWPQLDYLLWVAARRAGADEVARAIASTSVRGALASQWSEYWNADTGVGAGARPQTWTALALVMAPD